MITAQIRDVGAQVDVIDERVTALEAVKAAPTIPKFSEGDRVRAIVNGEFGDVQKGEYGEITELYCGNSHDPFDIRVETEDNHDYFRPQDLELVADKPAEETLGVGDYVVVNGENPYYVTNEDMTLGQIVADEGDGDIEIRIVAYKTQTSRVGDSYGVEAKYFRKATDAEISDATPKPKAGDIVVITANTSHSRNAVGDIGKVRDDHIKPFVDVPGKTKGNGNATTQSEMRHATPAEIAEYEALLKPNTTVLKVGDTVKVEGSRWFKDGTITKVKKLGGWNGFDPDYVLLESAGNGLSVKTKYVTKIDEPCVFTDKGRKPNEYRKGDVVRITKKDGRRLDVIGFVEDTVGDGGIGVRSGDRYRGVFTDEGDMAEIVCFAEDRKDIAKGVA